MNRGDIVLENNGSKRLMTVKVFDRDRVLCNWFIGSELMEKSFALSDLKIHQERADPISTRVAETGSKG